MTTASTRCSICLDSSDAADNPLFACNSCTSVVHRECLRSWDASRGAIISLWQWQPAQCVLGHPLAQNIQVRRSWRGQLEWVWTPVLLADHLDLPSEQQLFYYFYGPTVNAVLALLCLWVIRFFVRVISAVLMIAALSLLAATESRSEWAWHVLDTLYQWTAIGMILIVILYHIMALIFGFYLQFPPRPVYTVIYNKEKEA